MTIDFREGAFHKGLIRLSKSFQIKASQMIWEDKYIKDKISDEKIRKTYCGMRSQWRLRWNGKQILLSGLVTFVKDLFYCT